VRRILSSPTPKIYGPRTVRPGKLDPFVPRLETLVAERPGATASRLHRRMRNEGFDGGCERVKLWARARRREERARARACVGFETGPGGEAQFDWKGSVRGLIAGAPEVAVHFFRFVLAWSRARWALVVPQLKLPATLAALDWAFARAEAKELPYACRRHYARCGSPFQVASPRLSHARSAAAPGRPLGAARDARGSASPPAAR
jgi:transposase